MAERVQLDENQAEEVAGGNFNWWREEDGTRMCWVNGIGTFVCSVDAKNTFVVVSGMLV